MCFIVLKIKSQYKYRLYFDIGLKYAFIFNFNFIEMECVLR